MEVSISKGLVVADPWIGYILDGIKDWEMRSSGTRHRGWFGLVRKGTGAVWGVARLVDSGAQLSREEMLANLERHRIPAEMIESGQVAKWNTPWKMADVTKLSVPMPYIHKQGAVTWVSLNPECVAGIKAQLPMCS